jgi:hypothetical protein
LPPGQLQAATCGLSTSIAITTGAILIPAGILLGSLIGFVVGMAQETDEPGELLAVHRNGDYEQLDY